MGNDPFTDKLSPVAVWNPAQALESLKAEQDLVGSSSEAALTENRLTRAAPIAADVIIHLAQYSSNERIRLSAAQMILDRTLGKVTDAGTVGGVVDPFMQLLQQCVVDDATRGQAISVKSYEHLTPPDEESDG